MKLRNLLKRKEKPKVCQFYMTPDKMLYIKEIEKETKHLIRNCRKAQKKDLETQKEVFKNTVEHRNTLQQELKEIEVQLVELDRAMTDRFTKQQILKEIHEVEEKTGYTFK